MALALGAGCTDGSDGGRTRAELVRVEVALHDDTRTLPAFGGNAEQPGRDLQVVVWLGPTADARHSPLLLMAHGFDGDPDKFEALATDLAHEGIAVAAIRFPLTSLGASNQIDVVVDLPNQPEDLSFALDGLGAAAMDSGSPLYGAYNPDRLTVLGHSLGGATVLGLTRFEDSRDDRVERCILVAPAATMTTPFGPSVAAAGPTTLILHGLDDPTIAYFGSEDLLAQLDPPAWLVGIADGGHSLLLESQEVPALPARDATQRAIRAFVWDDGTLDATLADLHTEGHDLQKRGAE